MKWFIVILLSNIIWGGMYISLYFYAPKNSKAKEQLILVAILAWAIVVLHILVATWVIDERSKVRDSGDKDSTCIEMGTGQLEECGVWDV